MQPIQSGHHDIQSDHIGPHLVNDLQALGTIGRGHDLEALKLEVDPDQLPDDLVVINNKDPAGQARHISKGRRAPIAASGFCPLPPRAGDLSARRHRARPECGIPPPLPTLTSASDPASPAPRKAFMTTPTELVGFYPSERTATTPPP
ncbi:hypothetical protein GCM10010246_30160 [Streptomyces cuspidosporus]|uniref:Uncharacterized protein n=1 Tax=Streptomyces cuspidosporus TaxID=66882 RepID=A0ABN3G3M0_9ACTN